MLSRRAFLTGVVATAAAAAMPTVAPAYASGGFISADFGALDGSLWLHPVQWKFFEASGFDMSRCKLIGSIPWKASGLTSLVPASFGVGTLHARKPDDPNKSPIDSRNALTAAMDRVRRRVPTRPKIGSPRSVADAIRESRGRSANA